MTETRTDAVTGISGAHLYMYLAGLSVYITENMPSPDDEDDDERMDQFLRDVPQKMRPLLAVLDSILPQEETADWYRSDDLQISLSSFAGLIALVMPSVNREKEFLAFLREARSVLRVLIESIDLVNYRPLKGAACL